VKLELKTPWRDGTTQRVTRPPDFLRRLAARVPRPRLRLIGLHGVLAPNAKLRALVMPQGPPVNKVPATAIAADECKAHPLEARPHLISWARPGTGDVPRFAGGRPVLNSSPIPGVVSRRQRCGSVRTR
jgi:hypothetical protein